MFEFLLGDTFASQAEDERPLDRRFGRAGSESAPVLELWQVTNHGYYIPQKIVPLDPPQNMYDEHYRGTKTPSWSCQRPWCHCTSDTNTYACTQCIQLEEDSPQGYFHRMVEESTKDTKQPKLCNKRGPVFTASHIGKRVELDLKRHLFTIMEGYRGEQEPYHVQKTLGAPIRDAVFSEMPKKKRPDTLMCTLRTATKTVVEFSLDDGRIMRIQPHPTLNAQDSSKNPPPARTQPLWQNKPDEFPKPTPIANELRQFVRNDNHGAPLYLANKQPRVDMQELSAAMQLAADAATAAVDAAADAAGAEDDEDDDWDVMDAATDEEDATEEDDAEAAMEAAEAVAMAASDGRVARVVIGATEAEEAARAAGYPESAMEAAEAADEEAVQAVAEEVVEDVNEAVENPEAVETATATYATALAEEAEAASANSGALSAIAIEKRAIAEEAEAAGDLETYAAVAQESNRAEDAAQEASAVAVAAFLKANEAAAIAEAAANQNAAAMAQEWMPITAQQRKANRNLELADQDLADKQAMLDADEREAALQVEAAAAAADETASVSSNVLGKRKALPESDAESDEESDEESDAESDAESDYNEFIDDDEGEDDAGEASSSTLSFPDAMPGMTEDQKAELRDKLAEKGLPSGIVFMEDFFETNSSSYDRNNKISIKADQFRMHEMGLMNELTFHSLMYMNRDDPRIPKTRWTAIDKRNDRLKGKRTKTEIPNVSPDRVPIVHPVPQSAVQRPIVRNRGARYAQRTSGRLMRLTVNQQVNASRAKVEQALAARRAAVDAVLAANQTAAARAERARDQATNRASGGGRGGGGRGGGGRGRSEVVDDVHFPKPRMPRMDDASEAERELLKEYPWGDKAYSNLICMISYEELPLVLTEALGGRVEELRKEGHEKFYNQPKYRYVSKESAPSEDTKFHGFQVQVQASAGSSKQKRIAKVRFTKVGALLYVAHTMDPRIIFGRNAQLNYQQSAVRWLHYMAATEFADAEERSVMSDARASEWLTHVQSELQKLRIPRRATMKRTAADVGDLGDVGELRDAFGDALGDDDGGGNAALRKATRKQKRDDDDEIAAMMEDAMRKQQASSPIQSPPRSPMLLNFGEKEIQELLADEQDIERMLGGEEDEEDDIAGMLGD